MVSYTGTVETNWVGPQWRAVSSEAIGLVKRLMTLNPKDRPKAEDALKDPWLVKNARPSAAPQENLNLALGHLREFKTKAALQRATLAFIASHMVHKNDEKRLRDTFAALDKNNDGQLSEQELIQGYKMLYEGDMAMAQAEAKKVMHNIDLNKNGNIDYNGTLSHTLA